MKDGDWIQLIGIATLTFGIVYEIVAKAHAGWVAITVGSFVFAIGTKLKHM